MEHLRRILERFPPLENTQNISLRERITAHVYNEIRGNHIIPHCKTVILRNCIPPDMILDKIPLFCQRVKYHCFTNAILGKNPAFVEYLKKSDVKIDVFNLIHKNVKYAKGLICQPVQMAFILYMLFPYLTFYNIIYWEGHGSAFRTNFLKWAYTQHSGEFTFELIEEFEFVYALNNILNGGNVDGISVGTAFRIKYATCGALSPIYTF